GGCAGCRRRWWWTRQPCAGRWARSGEAARRPGHGTGGDRARARMSRVVALDHGDARCGVAVSDPTGELVTPLAVVERPDTKRGLARVADVVREREAELVVVGLPL